MKKLATLFVLLTAFLPDTVFAEPIVVRSGEHDKFTRLVMRLPTDIEWRIEENERNHTLIISEFDEGFDLSSAFEIIPRTRLKALVAKESQLELQLACDCQIDAFVEQNSFLVIDIANSDASLPNAIVEIDSFPQLSRVPDSVFSYGDLLWSQLDQAVTSDLARVSKPNGSERTLDDSRQNDAAENELVADTQERLLSAFSSAASRGILTAKTAIVPQASVETPRDVPTEIFDSSRDDQASPIPLTGNMRITDSRDVPGSASEQNMAVTSIVCVDPAIVDIAAWGTGSGIGEQVGASVLELYDQAGRLNEENVLKHARLQLFFGLGQEAKQTLQMLPGLTTENPELLDIANVLEFGHANNPRSLHRFADCDSDLALWGLLTAREVPADRPVNAQAALRGLQKLPDHLRFYLAQTLSARFSARGDLASASIALRSFENSEKHDDKPKLAQAEVSELRNESDTAKGIIKEITKTETSETPQAIVELIDRHIDANEAVPAELALLAETYAFELRGSEEGENMFRAFVLSMASSGQQEKAFEAIGDMELELDAAMKTELISSTFSALAKNASEMGFLENYFKHFSKNEEFIDPLAALETADRLFDLGFQAETEAVLSKLPNDYLSRDARLLKSKVSISNGDFENGYSLVRDLTGPDAAALKGEAMEGMDQMELAAGYFSAADTKEDARDMIWLSEDWRTLLPENDDLFGSVRALADEEVSGIPRDDQMISNSSEALAASANARQTLERLLTQLEF